MRRTVIIAVPVALFAVAVALLYTALSREAEYRRLIAEGESAMAADQTFVAVEAFSGAIVLKPEAMLAYLRRGEAYRKRAELPAALRDLRKASQLDPTAPRPLEEIGDVNLALERHARAAESYEAYLRLDDRSAPVFYKLALSRFRQSDPSRAVPALRQAIALNDRFAEAFYLLGVCQGQLNQHAEAVASLERAIRLSPTLAPAREELVRLLLVLERENEAIRQLEALAALDPSRADHLVEAGLVYARLGRTDLALAELNRAAERDPQPRVYQALGRMWLEAAESKRDKVALSKALEALDRGVRGPGATSEGLTLYGRALLLSGDANGAQQAFEQAIEKTPVDPAAYRDLAYLAERRGNLLLARNALARHLAVLPSGANAQGIAQRIAEMSLKLGQPAAAVEWLRQAAEAAGDDPEAIGRVARLQIQAGDRAGAATIVERGLRKSPTNALLLALQRSLNP